MVYDSLTVSSHDTLDIMKFKRPQTLERSNAEILNSKKDKRMLEGKGEQIEKLAASEKHQ